MEEGRALIEKTYNASSGFRVEFAYDISAATLWCDVYRSSDKNVTLHIYLQVTSESSAVTLIKLDVMDLELRIGDLVARWGRRRLQRKVP